MSQQAAKLPIPIRVIKRLLYLIGLNIIKPPVYPPNKAPRKHTIPESPPIENIIEMKIIMPKMRANCFRIKYNVTQLIVKYATNPPSAP